MFDHFFGYEAKRRKLLATVKHSALKHYLSVPLPATKSPIADVNLLSLDFETTGLDARNDALLSIGYVDVTNLAIPLASSEHILVQPDTTAQQDQVVLHQITEQEQASGCSLAEAVEQLLIALSGKVMLAHYAHIELSFLKQACLKLYGVAPPFPVIDTLALAKRRLDKRQVPYDPSQLRLVALREHYTLPKYYAHNALNDAVATAELFLYELNHHHQTNAPLKEFLR
ncbi:exonuclease domain-containing protein [Thalassotalea euphylliae]|uniref:exonuclease domain-containing protein n=1 Tax=Thalassotalea euphylliae TaxID=1655234 RepID=UPI003637352F